MTGPLEKTLSLSLFFSFVSVPDREKDREREEEGKDEKKRKERRGEREKKKENEISSACQLFNRNLVQRGLSGSLELSLPARG